MANATLRKADKLHALDSITRAKYKERYDKLMARRRDLTQRVYDDTLGKTGYLLQNLTAKDRRYWLEYRDSLCLIGVPVAKVIVDSGKKPSMHHEGIIDLFTGIGRVSRLNDREFSQQLKGAVPWPEREFSNSVKLENATKATRKVGATLARDIEVFNEEAGEFYGAAFDVLMQIRTINQLDRMFPELWQYLPDGLRERVKQAVVPLDQSTVDQIRAQLPK